MDRTIDTLKQRLEQIVSPHTRKADPHKILDIYEDFIRYVWHSILPTLGRLTAAALMERALALTRETYAGVRYLHVVPEGLSFSDLRARVQQESPDELQNGLQTLILHLFGLLSTLTGNILVQQMLEEIEHRFRQGNETGAEDDPHEHITNKQTGTR